MREGAPFGARLRFSALFIDRTLSEQILRNFQVLPLRVKTLLANHAYIFRRRITFTYILRHSESHYLHTTHYA
jgi:hypothetical protein